MKTKLCVFDLDGTLTNTLNTIAHYGNTALGAFGFQSIPTERYKLHVGNGAEVLIMRMLRDINKYNDEAFNKVYKYYNEIYDASPNYLTAPYEGICEVLGALSANSIKKAVFSNKPEYPVKKVVEEFFSDYRFDAVRGAAEGQPKKPDPTVLFSILDELNVSPDECVYIGDSDVDMQTGKSAGVFTIGAAWGFRTEKELREAGADVIAKSPKELIKILGL